MQTGACTFLALLVNFSSVFSAPSFNNFVILTKAWVLCTGQRTISRVLQFGGLTDKQRQHHSTFYRFFSRAKWDADVLSECVLQLVLRVLPDGFPLVLIADDTLCRRSGAHIWGCGMHHDPLLSNYGRGKTLVKFFSFGHSWVILCACVPLPWDTMRVMAIPIGFRLYRSKKHCHPSTYRKRTQLARELLDNALTLVSGREIRLIADTEYACKTLVRDLPDQVVFVGPMHMGAALYGPPESKKGRGRPSKKGSRLLSPRELIAAKHIPWSSKLVIMYGREVEVLYKTQVALWYTVAGARLVKAIVTRDPAGRIDDRAYFTADPQMSVEEFALLFSFRWSQEEMHHNAKHYLGLEDPQNGWWRRPAGKRRNRKIPGPKPHKKGRGIAAVSHTVPFILTTYSLILLWYLEHGSFDQDVERARRRAPWYRHKTNPAFSDMLAALRRHLWSERIISLPYEIQGCAENDVRLNRVLEDLLCAA